MSRHVFKIPGSGVMGPDDDGTPDDLAGYLGGPGLPWRSTGEPSRDFAAGYGPTVTEGVWAFEMTLLDNVSGGGPCAIGVALPTYASARDSESFYGFYHGGASRNVISNGGRLHNKICEKDCPDWQKGMSVGIVVCMDTRTLWCTVNGVKLPEEYTLPAGSIPMEVRFAIWSHLRGDISSPQVRFPRRL